MIKVIISEEEWYPIYSLKDYDPKEDAEDIYWNDSVVEISDELYNKMDNLMKDFDKIQNELKALYESAKKDQKEPIIVKIQEVIE